MKLTSSDGSRPLTMVKQYPRHMILSFAFAFTLLLNCLVGLQSFSNPKECLGGGIEEASSSGDRQGYCQRGRLCGICEWQANRTVYRYLSWTRRLCEAPPTEFPDGCGVFVKKRLSQFTNDQMIKWSTGPFGQMIKWSNDQEITDWAKCPNDQMIKNNWLSHLGKWSNDQITDWAKCTNDQMIKWSNFMYLQTKNDQTSVNVHYLQN